jgi:hypothetical protein
MSGWKLSNLSGPRPAAHVHPVSDSRAHTLSMFCWCRPVIQEVGVGVVVTHNAHDQREKYETGERKRH